MERGKRELGMERGIEAARDGEREEGVRDGERDRRS